MNCVSVTNPVAGLPTGLDDGVARSLLEVVAAGAPPQERVGAAAALPPSDKTAQHAARWARAVAGTEDLAAPALCAALATGVLGDRDPLVAFADLDPARLERLPPWAVHLGELLAALPEDCARDGQLYALRDAMRAATASLAAADLGALAEGRALDSQAVTDFGAAWAELILTTAAPAIDFELRFLGGAEIDGSRDGWTERLCGLPVLGFLIGTALRQRRAAAREMLNRLAADRPVIAATMFGGRDPGPVAAVATDAGDPHDDGRSVSLLTFASGDRVVYKPRDLRCAVAYQQFLAALDGAFPDGGPLRRRMVLGDGYAWDEYIHARPAKGASALPRYIRRLGRLVRIAAVLHARDLWQDNLLAAGEHPVLVDLETLLQPDFSTGTERTATADAAIADLLSGTALPTGLVTAPVLIGGGLPAIDTGGACPAQPTRTPYRPNLPRLVAIGKPLRLDEGTLTWQPPRFMAWSGTEVADPRQYADELTAGYEEADRALAKTACRMLRPGGAAYGFDGTITRVMRSSTWDAYTLLRAGMDPAALTHATAREAVLAAPLRRELAALSDLTAAESTARLRIAAAEVRDLRRSDVPILLHVVGTSDIITSAGEVLPGLLTGDAAAGLRERLLRMTARQPQDIDGAAVLTSCQHMVDHHTGYRRPVPPRARQATRMSPDELVGRAGRVISGLWDAAVPTGRDRRSWIGLHLEPRHRLLMLGPAAHGLADGLAGLLVATGEMAAALGTHHWRSRTAELIEILTDSAGEPGLTSLSADDLLDGKLGIRYALRRAQVALGKAVPAGQELEFVKAAAKQQIARLAAEDTPRAWLLSAAEAAAMLASAKAGPPIDPFRPAFWRLAGPVSQLTEHAWPEPSLLTVYRTDALLAQGELASAVATAPRSRASAGTRQHAIVHLAAVAAELVARHQAHGRYLIDNRAAECHQLSVLDGMPAVAVALLRAGGRAVSSVPLLEVIPPTGFYYSQEAQS